jgi:hypothetical protein
MAVLPPQLIELFAPDFFVDFVEYVAHGIRPRHALIDTFMSPMNSGPAGFPSGRHLARLTEQWQMPANPGARCHESLVPIRLMMWREQGKMSRFRLRLLRMV